MKKMTNVQVAFLVAAIYETFFAIPVLGWILYTGSFSHFVIISLVIHIVALILANQEKVSVAGSMVGILASALAFIPVLGWMLHIVAAILNYLQVFEVSLVNSKNDNHLKNNSESKKDKSKIKDAEIEENK